MEPTTPEQPSLRELAGTLFIYKWTIVITTLVCFGGAVIVSLVQPEVFEASVQMLAQDQSPGLRGTSNYAADTEARTKHNLTKLREVMLSRSVLLAALERSGQLKGSAGGNDADPVAAASIESQAGKLRKAVRIEAPKGMDFGASPIFFVRVRNEDRQVALTLLTELLNAFRERHERLSAEQANHLLHETTLQLEKSRDQLATTERLYQQFIESLQGGLAEMTSLGGSSSSDSELRRGLISINEQIVPAESALQAQQNLLEQIRKARDTAGEPLVLPGVYVRDYPGLEAAARELATVRLKMSSVAARLTPQAPEYQMTVEQLRNTETAYVEEIDRALEGIEREVAIKAATCEFLRAKQQDFLRRLALLVDKHVEFEGMKEQLRQRRLIVEGAERRRSDAAHAVLTAAQEVLYSAVDAPRASLNPVSPRRTLNVVLGTLLGLVNGIGLAFLARHYSQTVRSESDLTELVERLPIVSVPRVRVPFQRAS